MVRASIVASLFSLTLTALTAAQSVGPDVIVGDLPNVSNYGSSGSIAAFSVGTTSCNIGNQTLNWFANVNQHPVIGQNMYRIKDDRFEEIGMSWLKHGFAALAGSVCNTCQNPGTQTVLGVGCSDPYGSSLNGGQSGLGPRYEVNANTGSYPYPFTSPAYSGNIARRLQVAHADLDPAQNAGALYFVEGHYVTPDDAAAGNQDNNASYRPITVSPNAGSYNIAVTGSTVREKAAIWAWQSVDSSVRIQDVDVPGEGRFIFAIKTVDLGGGLYRHNVALHNLNSDRSARALHIDLAAGATQSSPYFHDVSYHSGEIWDGADWAYTATAGGPTWSTLQTFGQNPNANALRWGTCYSFGIDTNAPDIGNVTIDLFKPGTPSSVTFAVCPAPPVVPPFTGGYVLNASVPYDFVNISGNPVNGPTADDGSVTANIGFPFPFFSTSLTQVTLSANGYLTLVGQPGGTYTNAALPNGSTPNGVIAGYWDDLNPAVGGQIRYATVGTAPNRRFVAHWSNVPRFDNNAQLEDFELILDENGDITSTIVSSGNGGASATRGIEDPSGAVGIQYSFNTAGSAVAGTSLRYVRNSTIPHSAELTLIGNGAPFSFFGLSLLSSPQSPVLMMADLTSGPTSLGIYGSLDLGFSPAFAVIADGAGAFGPANPAAVTDTCGLFQIGVMIGAVTFPPGYTIHVQALVADTNAPNGYFHISNPVTHVQP